MGNHTVNVVPALFLWLVVVKFTVTMKALMRLRMAGIAPVVA